jgi:predicted RNA-binding protein with TRAM domain
MPIGKGKTYNATIQDIARLGDGIARIESFVVFVPGTEIGDKIQIKLEKYFPTLRLQTLSSKCKIWKINNQIDWIN